MAFGAARAVLSVVGVAGQADAASGGVTLTEGFAGLALNAHSVGHIITTDANALAEAVVVAVGGAGLLHAGVSLTDVAGVAHTDFSLLLTVLGAGSGDLVGDAVAEGVASETCFADASFSVENLVGAVALFGVVFVQLRDFVNEFRRTENVFTSVESGGSAGAAHFDEANSAGAAVAGPIAVGHGA